MTTPDHNRPKPGRARFTVEYLAGRGYFVRDPDGKRVSHFDRDQSKIEIIRAARQEAHDAAKKRKERPCLGCQRMFLSEGIHNRLCKDCRNRASNDQDAPFSFGAIHGRKRS